MATASTYEFRFGLVETGDPEADIVTGLRLTSGLTEARLWDLLDIYVASVQAMYPTFTVASKIVRHDRTDTDTELVRPAEPE